LYLPFSLPDGQLQAVVSSHFGGKMGEKKRGNGNENGKMID